METEEDKKLLEDIRSHYRLVSRKEWDEESRAQRAEIVKNAEERERERDKEIERDRQENLKKDVGSISTRTRSKKQLNSNERLGTSSNR